MTNINRTGLIADQRTQDLINRGKLHDLTGIDPRNSPALNFTADQQTIIEICDFILKNNIEQALKVRSIPYEVRAYIINKRYEKAHLLVSRIMYLSSTVITFSPNPLDLYSFMGMVNANKISYKITAMNDEVLESEVRLKFGEDVTDEEASANPVFPRFQGININRTNNAFAVIDFTHNQPNRITSIHLEAGGRYGIIIRLAYEAFGIKGQVDLEYVAESRYCVITNIANTIMGTSIEIIDFDEGVDGVQRAFRYVEPPKGETEVSPLRVEAIAQTMFPHEVVLLSMNCRLFIEERTEAHLLTFQNVDVDVLRKFFNLTNSLFIKSLSDNQIKNCVLYSPNLASRRISFLLPNTFVHNNTPYLSFCSDRRFYTDGKRQDITNPCRDDCFVALNERVAWIKNPDDLSVQGHLLEVLNPMQRIQTIMDVAHCKWDCLKPSETIGFLKLPGKEQYIHITEKMLNPTLERYSNYTVSKPYRLTLVIDGCIHPILHEYPLSNDTPTTFYTGGSSRDPEEAREFPWIVKERNRGWYMRPYSKDVRTPLTEADRKKIRDYNLHLVTTPRDKSIVKPNLTSIFSDFGLPGDVSSIVLEYFGGLKELEKPYTSKFYERPNFYRIFSTFDLDVHIPKEIVALIASYWTINYEDQIVSANTSYKMEQQKEWGCVSRY